MILSERLKQVDRQQHRPWPGSLSILWSTCFTDLIPTTIHGYFDQVLFFDPSRLNFLVSLFNLFDIILFQSRFLSFVFISSIFSCRQNHVHTSLL